jgi:hypothetical protein
VSEDTAEKMAVGRVIGYNKVLNPFKRQYKVRISVNDRTVTVLVDESNLNFVRKKYWTGGRLAVGFYGGKWHIGVPPEIPLIEATQINSETVDLLENELGEMNIKELIGPPDKSIDSVSGVPSKVISMEDSLLQDIDKFSGYLKWVEQYTRENADDILDRIQLSHLSENSSEKLRLSEIAAVENKKKNDRNSDDYIEVLDYIITQNDEIILGQNEIKEILDKMASRYEDELTDY